MLVCLDLDNTLNDRQAAVEDWTAEFLADHDLPAEDRAWLVELDGDGYRPRHEAFTAIRNRYGLAAAVETLVRDYRDRVIELARPLDGAIECLQDLRDRGWASVIVSNGSSDQQHRKIDRLGVRELVDAVVVSEDLGIKKPDPRIFEHAAALVGHSLNGGWMVGDAALHDVVGARRCGMHTVWIRRGRTWDSALGEPPDLAVDHLHGLASKLASASVTEI